MPLYQVTYRCETLSRIFSARRRWLPPQYDFVILPPSLPGKLRRLAVPRKPDDRQYEVNMVRLARLPVAGGEISLRISRRAPSAPLAPQPPPRHAVPLAFSRACSYTPVTISAPALPASPTLFTQKVVRSPNAVPTDDCDFDTWELLSYQGVTDSDVAAAAAQLGAQHLSPLYPDSAAADAAPAAAWPSPVEGRVVALASGLELPAVAARLSRMSVVSVSRSVVFFVDPSSPASYLTAEAFTAFGHDGTVTGPQRGYSLHGVPFRPRASHGPFADVCVLGADYLRSVRLEIEYSNGGRVRLFPKDPAAVAPPTTFPTSLGGPSPLDA